MNYEKYAFKIIIIGVSIKNRFPTLRVSSTLTGLLAQILHLHRHATAKRLLSPRSRPDGRRTDPHIAKSCMLDMTNFLRIFFRLSSPGRTPLPCTSLR